MTIKAIPDSVDPMIFNNERRIKHSISSGFLALYDKTVVMEDEVWVGSFRRNDILDGDEQGLHGLCSIHSAF